MLCSGDETARPLWIFGKDVQSGWYMCLRGKACCGLHTFISVQLLMMRGQLPWGHQPLSGLIPVEYNAFQCMACYRNMVPLTISKSTLRVMMIPHH